MKVLYVGMNHGQYAAPSHEAKLARVMAEAGHEVLLVADQEIAWDSPVPETLKVRVAPVNDPRVAREVAKGLVDQEFDVGFASSVSGAPILEEWKKESGKPVVAQVLDVPLFRLVFGNQGPWLEQWRPWFKGLMAMDALVVNTPETMEHVLQAADLYEWPKDKVPEQHVVYYGIDTEQCDQAEPMERPNGATTWLGVVTRLVPYKGIEQGIMALKLMRDERELDGFGMDAGYVVVGGGEDALRLMQMCMMTRVPACFPGPVSDVHKWGIIKSLDAGLGLAWNPFIPFQFPMECVYAGKPCVVANTPINRSRFGNCGGIVYTNPWATEEVARDIGYALTPGAWGVSPDRDWVREKRSFHSHAKGVLQVLEAL